VANKEPEKLIEQLRQDYKIIFNTDEGKRILNDLEKRCHEFVTTFSKNSSYETAFLEGQRSVLIFIKAMITKK
tara:strand:+ start:545 stop:763 length:219 start_codon:yes stop_codon:yes gene_type:complete